uniref:TIR domain-containing protein n=1 Tax=Candidatus Kentrum sp. MB TaxID=2138164 RepID=A0A450X1H8_9GAMM|nr:MAG: TIR domain-containing protein [Candidatus Kentron sp. MB]
MTGYDIFLSHRGENKPWVEVLARNLQAFGYRVFLDTWELQPGRSLASQLDHALENSRVGVLVATPEARESPWVREEYEKMLGIRNRSDAASRNFIILPLVFGQVFDQRPSFPFLENRLCIDFSDPSPQGYGEAFQRLLSALPENPPGNAPDPLPTDLRIPDPMHPRLADVPGQPLPGGEAAFLQEVSDALTIGQPVLLLAQAGRDRQGRIHQAILKQAERLLHSGPEVCRHLIPPSASDASLADYCAFIAHQAGLPGTPNNAIALESALEQRLLGGEPLFLLITRLASGSAEGRRALAGVLRNVSEHYPHQLHLVLCGAEQLAAFRFADGDLSLLNHTQALYWPEPTTDDLIDWQRAQPAGFGPGRDNNRQLTREQAARLLEITGGHPLLLNKCLRQWARGGPPDCQPIIARDPDLTALFTRYRQLQDNQKAKLLGWLDRTRLAVYSHWPVDGLLRRLFWDNLLVERDGWFTWRCEALRQLGIRVMEDR